AERADGAGERAADFALSAETLDEARARTAREEQQRADDARQRREDDRRAQADAMRDDFVLTGSDRGADQAAARGQQSMFSNRAGRGITADQAREAIAADTYGHDVDVYDSLDDAPDYVREQAEGEGAKSVEGFWDSRTNRVALIASNIDSPERAVQVARHELLAHYGLENMLGAEEMARLAQRVITAERDGNKAIAEAAAKVDRTQPGLPPESRAREIVAVMAESGAHNSIVRRVLDAIRQFLRKIGFIKSDVTDAEIAQLLRDTQAYLREKGAEQSAESGTSFSARDRIDYSQDELKFGPRQSFEVPEPRLWDNIVRALQDNKIDLKRVQDAIRNAGNTIRERSDAYLNEELYHGRVSAQVDDLVDRRVTPLLKAVHESGLSLAEVNRYLFARHAPERNEQLAKINPHRRHNQALSGMSNTESAGILGAFRNEGKTEKLERIAAMVDAITKESRRRIVSSGLEQREVVDAWESAYKNYVPLMQDMPSHGRRKVGGFDVRGPESQRSLGQSDSNIAKAAIQQDIVANVIAQAQTTIQRAEKAKVARSLLDLAREFPNDKFWRVDQPPKKKRINPDTGLVELADDPNFKAKENVLTVKENGVEHFIVFNERDERAMRLAEAMQSLDAPQLPWAIEAFGKVTRYLSQWITARNPLFWITNFARDVQGAAFNLQNTPIAGKEAKVLASIPKAMAGYWKIVRGDGGGQWAEYARQFKEDGSETGYVKSFESPADRMADLEKQVEEMKQGKADPRRLARSLVEMIDDYNNIVENGVRLAVYQTARDAGISNRQAASLAKNITVNFNRRGSQTAFANSLYMFFNANLQGNARFLGALAKNRRAQVVAGGLVAMGFVMDAVNRAVGGDDDETGKKKYDEIPDFEKERNWIFMSPSGKYVKVPLPIGPHVMVNAGRLMSEMIFKKGGGVLDKGASMTRVALDAFNPMGSPGSLSQFLLPSVVKPLAQAAENKSFNGGPVYREGDDRSYTGPAYDRAFRSTGDQWKAASKLLNDVTGGDSVKPGAIDVPPEVLRLMFTSYLFPGITQTADKTVTTISDSSKGKKVEASQIPALSRFYGEAPEERAQERAFYEETKKLKQTVGQAKRYAKDGNREGMERVLTELGDGDLAAGKKRMGEFDAAEKALLNLNKARKRIETDDKPDADQRELLNDIDERRMKVMRRILSGQK
ncbi:LPD38 domain-containing protein, partial [Ensifer sp. SSB1]|uniref:LPD38 domain-containing protein n=1 Tax=Ensifer sp. SSB1 TaxID=2795385 RepID=UPI001A61DF99